MKALTTIRNRFQNFDRTSRWCHSRKVETADLGMYSVIIERFGRFETAPINRRIFGCRSLLMIATCIANHKFLHQSRRWQLNYAAVSTLDNQENSIIPKKKLKRSTTILHMQFLAALPPWWIPLSAHHVHLAPSKSSQPHPEESKCFVSQLTSICIARIYSSKIEVQVNPCTVHCHNVRWTNTSRTNQPWCYEALAF